MDVFVRVNGKTRKYQADTQDWREARHLVFANLDDEAAQQAQWKQGACLALAINNTAQKAAA